MEFDIEVRCPYCESEYYTCTDFPEHMWDRTGMSKIAKDRCQDCDKDFWYEANLAIEVEAYSTYTKDPSKKKVKK